MKTDTVTKTELFSITIYKCKYEQEIERNGKKYVEQLYFETEILFNQEQVYIQKTTPYHEDKKSLQEQFIEWALFGYQTRDERQARRNVCHNTCKCCCFFGKLRAKFIKFKKKLFK